MDSISSYFTYGLGSLSRIGQISSAAPWDKHHEPFCNGEHPGPNIFIFYFQEANRFKVDQALGPVLVCSHIDQ
jgi:hypothetical protein